MAEQHDLGQREVLDHRVQEEDVRRQVVLACIGQPAGCAGADGLDVDHGQVLLEQGHAQVLPADAWSSGVGDAHGTGSDDVVALLDEGRSVPDGDCVSTGGERTR